MKRKVIAGVAAGVVTAVLTAGGLFFASQSAFAEDAPDIDAVVMAAESAPTAEGTQAAESASAADIEPKETEVFLGISDRKIIDGQQLRVGAFAKEQAPGKFEFFVNGIAVDPAAVSTSDGKTELAFTPLAGDHEIKAVFTPDNSADFKPAESVIQVSVVSSPLTPAAPASSSEPVALPQGLGD
ncbi:hypothetical protein KJY77_02650 [Canibacter sp. lx-72]|uniref:hypothetical protein n=1 Tax=Canibacter zhuwentaonis TaxID=2837491 RepID=UPI001BDBC981|nr:hypothetical protein [Canibacter zhuwentaonis]MBT1018042.1 hypothetical protein [Canibacter zhuwentaonis]MBT1035423.1 hypothetical protein [Canibacter zhuwentaonis]